MSLLKRHRTPVRERYEDGYFGEQMNKLTVIVTLADFENSKDSRASITQCLFATTLAREFPQSAGDIAVGVESARIGNVRYSIDQNGSQLIRSFVHRRDEEVEYVLPLTVTITEQGTVEDE